jgi:hypothetical protein
MIDLPNMRLGRLPHDPERIAAAPQHRMSAEAPAPIDCPRPTILTKPSLVYNDTLPTCCIAGLLNYLRAWAQQEHGFDLPENDQLLLDLYGMIYGCPPTIEAIAVTDGLVLMDVLEYIQANGFRIDSQNVVELAFTSIDVTDMAAIRDSIDKTGGAYLGVTLFEADVTPGLLAWTGDIAASGPVAGGHCITAKDYTKTAMTDATWGELIVADDAWLLPRLDEAFSIRWIMATA